MISTYAKIMKKKQTSKKKNIEFVWPDSSKVPPYKTNAVKIVRALRGHGTYRVPGTNITFP